jgi:hypothetical protein
MGVNDRPPFHFGRFDRESNFTLTKKERYSPKRSFFTNFVVDHGEIEAEYAAIRDYRSRPNLGR